MSPSTGSLRGPDFFLVGAPKCGTTAMADYLSQHPEIGMCERKETHQFAPDLHARMVKRDRTRRIPREQYLGWFASVQNRRRLGEASVWYLYSAEAPRRIDEYRPDAQIVVMLRDPVQMLPALHSEFVHQAIEPIEDFERALALDEKRERDGAPRGFPPTSYRAAARYAEQLERYFEVFGRDRVRVILYEDFRDRTADEFSSTCSFLGVAADFEADLRVVNASHRPRSMRFQRFQKRPPEPLRRVLHRVTSQSARGTVGRAISRWNTHYAPRAPISAELEHLLRAELAPEVNRLRDLLGLELASWPGAQSS